MYPNYHEDERYKQAKKRVKDIQGFYIHLVIYLFVNFMIIFYASKDTVFGDGKIEAHQFYTAIFWGIGLFAHWASVFGPSLLLGKKWEEKKIREFMEKDKEQQKRWE